jgi:hypothetical protein
MPKLPRRKDEPMADEDLLKLIDEYDSANTSYEDANATARRANEHALGCAARKTSAAEPLKKRCGPNIPKRYLRAKSGNVYEVTADCINKVEIQGA